ncbi:MAG: methyltransferase domain-containing protein [Candidatus Liptonbacteria bacterium]|nr:methyltransferase domain-containing protein [Parcubacteria group bacterium]MBI4087338.1 methyltransferase domain-containing protein [Candidatus Liptonbacteria bacterium]
MPKIITRKTCRLCGENKLKKVLNLGNLYVSTFVSKRSESGGKAPLELLLCENKKCNLLQLRHTAPQEFMYTLHYWYRSGIQQVIVDDLKDIAQKTQKMARVKKGDVILDIGANDGTLLGFYPKKYIRVGCEPANNLQKELKKRADHIIHEFWSAEAYKKLKLPPAKIVTAIGMFYDMEDPNQFVRDAERVMAKDGIFVAQLMTLKPMIEKNDLGNICHEHLEFYSYPSLKYLFEKNGLEIFKVEENSINGGSYRLYARKFRRGSINYPEPRFDYRAFAKRLEESKKKTVGFIKKAVREGKKVYGYGASTKGNTILQYFGLTPRLVKAVSDKSKEKWGKYTVGTMIPIVSEEKARKDRPDYFLILPWAFTDAFVKRERKFFKRGGKFIVPFPKFRVVSEKLD